MELMLIKKQMFNPEITDRYIYPYVSWLSPSEHEFHVQALMS